jgi:tetratricopeptide (TPR) repeat protein
VVQAVLDTREKTNKTGMKKNIRKIFLVTFLLIGVQLVGVGATAKKVNKKTANKAAPVSVQDQRQLGNLNEAIDLLTECYYINPRSSAVAYEFAMAYTAIQDAPHAIKFMALASRLDPTNSWYKIGFAELCIKNNDFKTAISVYEDITKNHPDKDDVDYMLASLYKQTGDLKNSISSLNKVEKKFGINETLSFEKYRLYKSLKETKKANAEIDKLIAKFPMEPKYKLLRGGIYMDDKEPKKALKIYNEVKASDPNNGMLIMALYEYYKSTGDTVQANSVFEEAFKNQNLAIDEKIGILTQFLSIENQSAAKAEEYFKLLLGMYSDNEVLHTYYASFLLMQHRYDEASSELEFLLKVNTQNKEAWLELIKLRLEQENMAEVLAVSDRAIKNMPDESSFYLFKGMALTDKKQYEDALQAYKIGLDKVNEEDTNSVAQLSMQMADVYAQLKKMDDAFTYYEKAYQINPNNATLLNNYAYYLSLAGKDLPKAESMSAKTVQAYPDNISFLDTYAWIFFVEGNATLARMYIQQAIDKGGNKSSVVVEHYADILYLNGEKDEALRWWQKAKDLGSDSPTLQQKIETKTYIPEK